MVQQVIESYWKERDKLDGNTRNQLVQLIKDHLNYLKGIGYTRRIYLGPYLPDKDPFYFDGVEFRNGRIVGKRYWMEHPKELSLLLPWEKKKRIVELDPSDIPFERYRLHSGHPYSPRDLKHVARWVEEAVESARSYEQSAQQIQS